MDCWARWVAIGHLTLAALLAVYLVMVGANSWVYRYNFWNDPPPNGRAGSAAVASLWMLALSAGAITAFGWGWMCRCASGGMTLRGSARGVVRPFLRSCWYATPLMIVTIFCVVLGLPGIVSLGLLGIVPFLSFGDARQSARYTLVLSRCAGPLAVTGCAALPLGLLFWTMVVATSVVGPVSPPLALLVDWVCLCTGAILLGGIASALAHVCQGCAAEAHPLKEDAENVRP